MDILLSDDVINDPLSFKSAVKNFSQDQIIDFLITHKNKFPYFFVTQIKENSLCEKQIDSCPICLETSEIIINYSCTKHGVCKNCIKILLKSETPKCPYCRAPIVTELFPDRDFFQYQNLNIINKLILQKTTSTNSEKIF